MQTMIVGNEVYIDGQKLPPLPHKHKSTSLTTIGKKVFVNGYEFKNGRWRRTLAAIWHYLF